MDKILNKKECGKYGKHKRQSPPLCSHVLITVCFDRQMENPDFIRRRLGDITQSTLTKQLRELESDGFIQRYIYQEIPPKVEYSLTELGKSFIPILETMKAWSETHLSIPAPPPADPNE